MISLKELNKHGYPISSEVEDNLIILCDRLNKIQQACGLVMAVTSGLRSEEDQQRINPFAMHSKHLLGQAADIYDQEKKLQEWCLANIDRLEGIGLWCEAFAYTPTWVHFQIVPPKSGTRFFIP